VSRVFLSLFLGLWALGCDAPSTHVVLDNRYPASTTNVVFQAFWQAVRFTAPLAPGASSDPEGTVAASANTAYVLLAPGWDPTADGGAPPTAFILLRSPDGFAVDLGQTLHIPVDDTTFAGNCAAGRFLSQAHADFASQRVFAGVFGGLHYDAATCATTGGPR
jgi:hypothetical protein